MARQLVIELVGEASKFVKSLDTAEKASQSFGDKVGSAGKKMSAFVSVPIAGFLVGATKAAMDDAAAQEHLATTLGNVVGHSQALVTQVEGFITSAQRVSTFTDDELRPAFETLVTSTHNAEEANKLLGIAMDVAAAKGIPLETAAMAVTKASEGQFTAVNKLVPGLIDVGDKSLTAEGAMKLLSDTFNGQAIAATETTAGKMQNLKRDLGEASEAMGAKLLPAVTGFADFATKTLMPALDGLSGGNGAFVLLAAALAGPVLTALSNVKNAVVGLDIAMKGLAANPVMLFLTSLAIALNDIQARMRATKDEGITLSNVLRGIPGSGLSVVGGVLGNLGVPGFRAAGGPVRAGAPYVVGERGPEIFVPGASGSIVPNGAGGGGSTVNVYVAGSVITERDLGRVIADAMRNNALIGVT